MKKYLFTLLLFTFAGLSANAQHDINTTLCFSDTAKYSFSSEWQYLSTDIYLFNGEKFSKLINELNFEGKRRRKRISQEELEYLFITAQLKDVKFFGDKDIAYPIYNFQVNRDKDNKYQTFVSDNIDKIRIIDNLPLYSASDKIDADIKVRAITYNQSDQLISLIATQLKSLAKVPTPTGAVFSLINEFGNFLESNSKKKEYKFSSTIRLFEQKNFDTRLHSIKIYALTTANSEPVNIDTRDLKTFMDTAAVSEISRDLLEKVVHYDQYPIIIVANYKSLYKMEQIRGDEVNQASIDKRKLRIENDFKAGLINSETYRQEKDFISFLSVFSGLKGMIETYSLNIRMGNPDAVTNGLFKVMQSYRQLLKMYDEIEFKYRNNSTFLTVFKSEYTSILGFASLYLEDDQNLKQTKNMVKTMVELEKDLRLTDPYVCENNLRNLRFSDIFKRANLEQTVEGQIIISEINQLEKFIFEKVFVTEIAKISNIKSVPLNVPAVEKLKERANNTACISCRDQAQTAIKDFYDGLTQYYKVISIRRRDSLAAVVENKLFNYFDKVELIEKNIKQQYKDTLPASVAFLNSKLLEVKRDMGNLNDFVKINVADKQLKIIDELNSKLVGYMTSIEENLSYIAEKRPDFVKPVPVIVPKVPVMENKVDQGIINNVKDVEIKPVSVDQSQKTEKETVPPGPVVDKKVEVNPDNGTK